MCFDRRFVVALVVVVLVVGAVVVAFDLVPDSYFVVGIVVVVLVDTVVAFDFVGTLVVPYMVVVYR